MCVRKDIAAIGAQKPIIFSYLHAMPVRKIIAEKEGVYFITFIRHGGQACTHWLPLLANTRSH
jgi:hypothetical protein